MGCCLSKTTPSPPPLSNVEPDIDPPKPQIPPTQLESKITKSQGDETEVKEEHHMLEKEEEKDKLGVKDKEGFVIHHKKSHDKKSELNSDSDVLVQSTSPSPPEAIATNIISMAANGTPVRTSSCTKEEVDAILIQCGRLSRSNSGKCPGSARKYSGSKRSHDFDKENNNVSVEVNCDDDGDERLRRRQSRGSHRRTTPSRSRERDPHSQRSGPGGGRRVSRSPGRRSESPNTATACNSNGSTTTAGSGRPGKMVSVPATITSLSMEKSNNGGEGVGTNTGSVKRVLVKRNVTPPRSRSPARSALVGATGVKNQPSPNRNSSRKAEHSPSRKHSPYRRTPLTDLDMNSLPFQPLANKASSTKGQPLSSASQTKLGVDANHSRGVVQGTHRRARSRGGEGSDLAQVSAEQSKAAAGHDETLTRSRSSRRSRDFDVNVEVSLNPNPTANYNSLLLQDIQSFHQKVAAPPFKLPECVSKACSIVEAVADLNLSSSSTRPVELMEPSLHKFVTVSSGGIDGEFDEQESTGSNSFVTGGGGHSWDEGVSPASFQRLAAVSQASSSHRSGAAARSRTGAGR